MSTTLTYGFVKPQTGDLGSTFWADLENDIQKLNDHTHNGTNSPKITAAAVTAVTQSILAASWSSTGTVGLYRQLVTIPGTLASIDDVKPNFKDSSGDYYNLRTEKVSTTTYYVYINDNSVSLTAVYVS